jgi:hypothetical protein
VPLIAQSPFERWDGDCGLSYVTLNTSDPIIQRSTPGISMDSRRYRCCPKCHRFFNTIRVGNGSIRLNWDSGFDDAESVSDKGAIGEAGVSSGIGSGTVVVAEGSRLVDIDASGEVAR